jgi:hypothetical protein
MYYVEGLEVLNNEQSVISSITYKEVIVEAMNFWRLYHGKEIICTPLF